MRIPKSKSARPRTAPTDNHNAGLRAPATTRPQGRMLLLLVLYEVSLIWILDTHSSSRAGAFLAKLAEGVLSALSMVGFSTGGRPSLACVAWILGAFIRLSVLMIEQPRARRPDSARIDRLGSTADLNLHSPPYNPCRQAPEFQ